MSKPTELKVNAATAGDAPFAPHGEYCGAIEDRFVTAHVRGPFNREIITALAKQIAEFYSRLPPVKTGAITVFDESMLFTADAIDVLRDLVAYELSLLPHGIVIAHVAAPSVEGSAFMPAVLEKNVYSHFGLKYQCFAELEHAQVWVREQLSQ